MSAAGNKVSRQVKPWTPAEETQLRAAYAAGSLPDLCEALGRPLLAVYRKAYELGLRRSHYAKRAALQRKKPAPVADAVVATLKAAGPAGCSMQQFLDANPGLNRDMVLSVLYRLVKKGEAWKVKAALGPSLARWFVSEAQAQAWRLAQQRPVPGPGGEAAARAAAAGAVMPGAGHKRERTAAACMKPALLPGAPVETARTLRVEAPRPPAHRFEAPEGHRGELKRGGIGHYTAAPSGWAAALIGGRT